MYVANAKRERASASVCVCVCLNESIQSIYVLGFTSIFMIKYHETTFY